MNDSNVLTYLCSRFSNELCEFMKMQLQNCGRPKHGRRYTDEQKSLCLAMYRQGPKSYRFKEKWCTLPTRRTLGRYSAELVFKSGIDQNMFDALQNVVKDWPQEQKLCGLTWDEVSLKERLIYSQSQDRIEGFIESVTPKFATHSLTFMLRGLDVSYKQAVSYFYTNGLKSFEFVELVKMVTERVIAAGN